MRVNSKFCIVEFGDKNKDDLCRDDFIKVFYNGIYLDKYGKLIDRDRLYSVDETNIILENHSGCGLLLSAREDCKGIDIIEELAYFEENADILLKTLDVNTVEEYKESLKSQGYEVSSITEEEFSHWMMLSILSSSTGCSINTVRG